MNEAIPKRLWHEVCVGLFGYKINAQTLSIASFVMCSQLKTLAPDHIACKRAATAEEAFTRAANSYAVAA